MRVEQLRLGGRRRVEGADDVDVHRHLAARRGARAVAVLVDDGDGAEHDADRVGADALAQHRDDAGLALPPTLSSCAAVPANAASRGDQVPTRSGTAARSTS